MSGDSNQTLRAATRLAVRMGGISVLRDPSRFLGYVADIIDAESLQMSVLYAWCDKTLMTPFADAAEMESAQALNDAARRGTEYLSAKAILPAAAKTTCDEISLGIGDAIGLSAVMTPQTEPIAATQVVRVRVRMCQFQDRPNRLESHRHQLTPSRPCALRPRMSLPQRKRSPATTA